MKLNTYYGHEFSLSSQELSAKCSYLIILTLINLIKEDIQTLYSWLPKRTLYYSFSPWGHIVKYLAHGFNLLLGGLNNVNLWYV